MPERPSVQYKDILERLDSISIFEVSSLKKAIEVSFEHYIVNISSLIKTQLMAHIC